MSPLAAVIFDMDGVLVDSEPLHHQATQAALGARGAAFTARDNLVFLGATDEEMFRVLRVLFDLESGTAELVAAKRGRLLELLRADARPRPGVPEVPRALREAGLLLGLVSASARPVIDAVLAAVGLRDAFRVVVSGDEVARGKPAPDGYLMAVRRLGVEPGQALAVEDSRNGVLAAREAGLAVAAIPCPATSREDFGPADLVLPSLEALPKALVQHGAGVALASSGTPGGWR
jgi:HAD superfamily hydrolase (TIGR01509 family)